MSIYWGREGAGKEGRKEEGRKEGRKEGKGPLNVAENNISSQALKAVSFWPDCRSNSG